jgi:hypothetical protein
MLSTTFKQALGAVTFPPHCQLSFKYHKEAVIGVCTPFKYTNKFWRILLIDEVYSPFKCLFAAQAQDALERWCVLFVGCALM